MNSKCILAGCWRRLFSVVDKSRMSSLAVDVVVDLSQ